MSTKSKKGWQEDWDDLCNSTTKHEFFALVRSASEGMGCCCGEGVVNFMVFAAKTEFHLRKKFEKSMKLVFDSSLKADSHIEDEANDDEKEAKKAMKNGTVKDLFDNSDELLIGSEEYSLLHYGEGDMTNLMLFVSNSKTIPKIKEKRMSISDELGIFETYDSHASISPAKKAWITIKANQQGKNPVMVHAGIKARFNRGK